jgi:hypothetical protein
MAQAHSTLAGAPILSGTVTLPRQGVWHAHLVLSAASAPTGAAVLQVGPSLRLQGTVVRSGLYAGEVRAYVVGGAGRLQTELPPRWYRGAPRELPLRDLCDEAGEQLSPSSDAVLLAEILSPGWARVRGPAAAALGRLLDGTGASWRLLPDGRLWAGPETWAPAQGMADLVVIDEGRARGRVVFATEAPQLLPGQTLRGDKVSDVEITIEPERLRVEALLERTTPGVGDRLKGALTSFVEGLVRRRTDYLGPRYGTVLKVDSAAGRVEVRLDNTDGDERPPLTGVELRDGQAGSASTVSPGCRVLVEFEGGSPRRPIARPHDTGGLKEARTTASEKITLNAPEVVLDEASGLSVARQGALVGVGGPLYGLQLVPIAGVSPPGPVVPGALYSVLWYRLDGSAPPSPMLFGSVLSGNPKVKA